MKNLLTLIKENKGIISIVGGSILAATGIVMRKRKSLKCAEIVKEFQETDAIIKQCAEECSKEEYSEEDKSLDLLKNAINTMVKTAKVLFVPYTTILLGGCITISGFFIVYKEKYMNEESVQYAY